MTLSEYILRGKDKIVSAGLECADPLLHMKQIAEAALELSTTAVYLRWDDRLSADELLKLETLLQRRLRGEPFQYIVGYEHFWNSKLSVGPGVLIPRRETELVVETLLRNEYRERVRIAELGGGSGCIGIATLSERPDWEWHAFELNPDSLPYLEKNRRDCLPSGVSYHIHAGDFFEKAIALGPYDWIVSNPPYVPGPDWPYLSREVRHEPRMALDAGPDGLDIIHRLVGVAEELLSTEGGFISEIESRQGDPLKELLSLHHFERVEIIKDWAGLDRIAVGRKGNFDAGDDLPPLPPTGRKG